MRISGRWWPRDEGATGPTSSWARHREVFQAAWATRKELLGPRRLADEQAFLPAALSLQETPPHPAPRRAALAICALFVFALAWACLGEVDVVAVAPGRIVVGEQTKLIQPLEASIVRAIHVRDGDVVQRGQLLVELDPTLARADEGRLAEARRAVHSERLRAQALLAAMGRRAIPSLGPWRAELDAGWRVEDHRDAEIQLQVEWDEHRARQSLLDAELARRRAEWATAQEQVAKTNAMLPLARQREADYRGLIDHGFMSGHAGQDRTRERIELERDLAAARARVAEAQAGLEVSRRSQEGHVAEARRTWQDRLTQATQRAAELAQEQSKAAQRTAQTRLSAPVDGTVQQLSIHTTGGVVTPAQSLMVIVPHSAPEALLAEVQLENKDIGFIRVGQAAEVKFETFDHTRYGTVPATVQWVTADAVLSPGAERRDDKGGAARASAVFPARLRLSRGTLDVEGRSIRLGPGLNLTAEVKTGRRTVIDYLLSPVRQTVGESLRER